MLKLPYTPAGEKGRVKKPYIGHSDKEIIGRLLEVNFRLGDYSWVGETIFVNLKHPYGLLGQIGFFDAFDVNFRYRSGVIELKPVTNS